MRTPMLLLGALLPSLLAAQERGCGDRAWRSIGVGAYHCPGGRCDFTVPRGPESAGFRFTAEPWLRAIDPAGPAAGRLAEGDVLVAVNGFLITTAPGGAELAHLDAGREAKLTVRRGERLLEVRVRPRETCAAPLMLVGTSVLSPAERRTDLSGETGDPVIDFTAPVRLSRTAVDLSLGMTLRCPGCELTVTASEARWAVPSWPVVERVERGGVAHEAGLRPGDEIRSVNGRDVRGPSGDSPLFALPRGDFTLGYARDGRPGSAFMNRRIVDEVVIRNRIRIELRDERRGDGLVGAIVRWWRDVMGSDDGRGAPGPWIVRGAAWGLTGLGVLFRGDDAQLFTLGPGDGRAALRLRSRPVVAEVTPGGPGAIAGLAPGDVITHVNGRSVLEREGTLALLAGAPAPLELTYLRSGQERRTTLTPSEER